MFLGERFGTEPVSPRFKMGRIVFMEETILLLIRRLGAAMEQEGREAQEGDTVNIDFAGSIDLDKIALCVFRLPCNIFFDRFRYRTTVMVLSDIPEFAFALRTYPHHDSSSFLLSISLAKKCVVIFFHQTQKCLFCAMRIKTCILQTT